MTTVAARIRAVRRELAALEQQQRDELIIAIARVVGPGEVFSAGWLWQQDELRTAFEEAGIESPRQLGKWLRQWVARVGDDKHGAIWQR